MTISELLDLVGRGGVTAMLMAALVGGFRGWYVWGWTYTAMMKERDEWQRIALQALHVAEKGLAK